MLANAADINGVTKFNGILTRSAGRDAAGRTSTGIHTLDSVKYIVVRLCLYRLCLAMFVIKEKERWISTYNYMQITKQMKIQMREREMWVCVCVYIFTYVHRYPPYGAHARSKVCVPSD